MFGARRPTTYVGPYRAALGSNSGYSGHAFWQFFDWLPRSWRDRINYALNPPHCVAEYRAAAAELYHVYASTPQGG